MSLFSALRTSVSGMNAQSSYLSSIGDNIANSSTVGYKDASTQFETVLGQQTPGSYESGGVLAQTRYGITDQGTLTSTTSSTDLAVQGNGFFVVSQSGTEGNFLTRAGSFVADKGGNLVNTAGFTLMGYAIQPDGNPSSTLSAVNVSSTTLQAVASSSGTMTGNLPSTDTPSSAPETKGITLYDATGTAINATLTFTNTASGQWSVSAADSSGNSLLSATALTFNASGQLSSGSPLTLTVKGNPVSLDISSISSLASGFTINPDINGSAPSSLSSVTVGTDGTLTGVYGSGAKQILYKIPLATVTSPDNLTPVTGNVYQQSATSGSVVIGSAGSGSTGLIEADNLESSTVDLATELTNMITAQRSYEANSKVLQAASDLLSKLNQIQTG